MKDEIRKSLCVVSGLLKQAQAELNNSDGVSELTEDKYNEVVSMKKQSGRFIVNEYSNGFEVEDTVTGETAWMSDGVDVLSDENGESLSPGVDGFVEEWENALNSNEDETLEAYFYGQWKKEGSKSTPHNVNHPAYKIGYDAASYGGNVKKLYADSPYDLGTDEDNHYRNGVDAALADQQGDDSDDPTSVDYDYRKHIFGGKKSTVNVPRSLKVAMSLIDGAEKLIEKDDSAAAYAEVSESLKVAGEILEEIKNAAQAPFYNNRTIVTGGNIADVRDDMACNDQRDELEVGCETWGIIYEPGQQRGQMTIWPSGRAACCTGGNSVWGEWDADKCMIALDDNDIYVDVYGNEHEDA